MDNAWSSLPTNYNTLDIPLMYDTICARLKIAINYSQIATMREERTETHVSSIVYEHLPRIAYQFSDKGLSGLEVHGGLPGMTLVWRRPHQWTNQDETVGTLENDYSN